VSSTCSVSIPELSSSNTLLPPSTKNAPWRCRYFFWCRDCTYFACAFEIITAKLLAETKTPAGSRLLLGALLLLMACSPIRLLRPNQRLLSRLELRGVEQADKERLTALAQQKPNTTLPLPKLAIYQLGHSFYDSVHIKRSCCAPWLTSTSA
jgi:hypothetical protein